MIAHPAPRRPRWAADRRTLDDSVRHLVAEGPSSGRDCCVSRAAVAGTDCPDPVPVSGKRRGLVTLSARVLASPVYRRLWVSGLIYNGARWVEIITSGWIVLALTGSPLLVGFTGFFRLLPMFLFGSLFGVLADRFPRVNILIGIHAVSLLAALILATTFLLDGTRL